jgi:ABC-type transport system involved in cytochrome c biogenesis ATPase subunit
VPAAALSVHGLVKTYEDGFTALPGLDLEVPAGAFFGLLGPNGAGKTTLISSVCNLIIPTAGTIEVFGEPHTTMAARRMVGLAEQDVNLDRFLDVDEVLRYHGRYWGMSRAQARRRAAEMMDIFDLTAKAQVRPPKLSGGMRRRLLLARALMHEPRSSSSTSRPRAWTSSCARSCGSTSAACTSRARRSSSPRTTSRRPRRCARRWRSSAAAASSPATRRTRCAPPTARDAGRRVRQGDGGGVSALVARHRGMLALGSREVLRVLKLWTQTILAPVVSSFLFIVVFGLSLSGRISGVADVPYDQFIVPGLTIMAMAQAAYMNNSPRSSRRGRTATSTTSCRRPCAPGRSTSGCPSGASCARCSSARACSRSRCR